LFRNNLSKNKSVDLLNGFNLAVGAPGMVGNVVGSYKVAVVLAKAILEDKEVLVGLFVR
jgi:hypothetical protein